MPGANVIVVYAEGLGEVRAGLRRQRTIREALEVADDPPELVAHGVFAFVFAASGMIFFRSRRFVISESGRVLQPFTVFEVRDSGAVLEHFVLGVVETPTYRRRVLILRGPQLLFDGRALGSSSRRLACLRKS